MVSRNYLKVVHSQAFPEFGLVVFFTQRRCHHIFCALEFRALIILRGQEKIMRTRFRMHRYSAISCLRNRVQRFAGGQMHDVERRIGQLRQTDGTMGGFAFQYGRTGGRVILRRAQTLRNGLLNQHGNHFAILGVDTSHSAVGARHAVGSAPRVRGTGQGPR